MMFLLTQQRWLSPGLQKLVMCGDDYVVVDPHVKFTGISTLQSAIYVIQNDKDIMLCYTQ